VLREVALDVCFLGVGALDPEFGATAFDDREAHQPDHGRTGHDGRRRGRFV
jgi:hypothetical protein